MWVCAFMCIQTAHTFFDSQFRVTVSDWLHSDGVLRVFMSLLIKCAHRQTHRTSKWIIITGLSPVSASSPPPLSSCNNNGLCQNLKWVHLNDFYFFWLFLVHTFIACQHSAEAPVYYLSGLLFTSTQVFDLSNTLLCNASHTIAPSLSLLTETAALVLLTQDT